MGWVSLQRGLRDSTLKLGATKVALLVAVLLVSVVLAGMSGPSAGLDGSVGALEVAAAALFVGAGALATVCWRLTAEGRCLFAGLALLVVGVAGPLGGPFTVLLSTVTAAGLVVAAVRAGRTDGPARPWTLAAVSCCLPLTGFIADAVLRQTSGPTLGLGSAARTALELLVAAIWLTLVASLVATGRRSRVVWPRRVAPLAFGMTLASLARAAAVQESVAWPVGWPVAGVAVSAGVAAMALRMAVTATGAGTGRVRGRADSLAAALTRAQGALAAEQEWRQELRHDAANALAALRITMTVITQHGDRLDAARLEQMHEAVISEIGHLDHLINRTDRGETVDFDVDSVVRPIAEAQRAIGLDVEVQTQHVWAHGQPADFATVIQNLLVNARNHGRGGAVTVRAEHDGDSVQVIVEDSGPGIPEQHRRRVFNHGVRGEHSKGSGLGLHVARRLMNEQNGTIGVDAARGGVGAAFSVTLPVARSGRMVPGEA